MLDVTFLTLPGMQLLDVIGPLEAFDAANRILLHEGRPPAYRLEVAGPDARVRSASGLAIEAAPLPRAPRHTVVIGGSMGIIHTPLPDEVRAAYGEVLARAARRVSVCAGAFVLGRLGLLDGRPCTTHWLALGALQREFPRARVAEDAIFTEDGDLFTAAGVTCGLDLALALIERDLGAKLALAVARALVVFLRRPGGQSQFSAALFPSSGADQRLRKLVAHIVERPAADLRVSTLAGRVGMSPRHFARTFKEQLGVSPARFVLRSRVEAARRLLERSDRPLPGVARDCGLGSAESLRRAFQRTLGVTPGAYRARFRKLPRGA